MDFALAFSYPFKDPEWISKILVSILISLIPAVGWVFILGWSLGITQRVILNDMTPLPHMRFLDDFVRGLKAIGLAFIYSLPLLLVVIPTGFVILNTLTTSDQSWANGINLLLGWTGIGAILIYSLVLIFILPAAYGLWLANDENMNAALDVNAVFGIVRAAPTVYLLVMVGTFLCRILAGVGFFLCLIGVTLTSTYAYCVIAHLNGQAFNAAKKTQSEFPRLQKIPLE